MTAARQLVDQTCAKYKIPLYILHDFDISGFTIAKTLCSDTRRYQFETRFKVVDLGLRLADVEALGLADSDEPVFLGKGNKNNRRAALRAAGAKPDEIAFLLDDDGDSDDHHGKRVELNAMTSRQFVDFIERKLVEANVRKVIPAKADLDNAYRLFMRGDRIMKAARKVIRAIGDQPIDVPKDLKMQVQAYLAEHPTASWDDAVLAISKKSLAEHPTASWDDAVLAISKKSRQ